MRFESLEDQVAFLEEHINALSASCGTISGAILFDVTQALEHLREGVAVLQQRITDRNREMGKLP